MKPYCYRQIKKNIFCVSDRYYAGVGKMRQRLKGVKNDNQAIEAARPILAKMLKVSLAERLDRVRKRQAKEIQRLEAALRKRWGLC